MKRRVAAIIAALAIIVVLVAVAVPITVVLLRRRSRVDSGDGLVIIVGSGVSGARAALEFARAKRPFLIVEASDGVGGRIRSASLGPDMRVELGANWIHSYGENDELEQFANNEVKLIGVPTDFEDTALVTGGKVVMQRADPIWQRYTNAHAKTVRGARRSPDTNVKDAMKRFGGWVAANPKQCAVEQYFVDYWFGLSADSVSVRQLDDDISDPDPTEDYFIKDPRGYSAIVNELLRQAGVQDITRSGPKLLLNAPVKRIQYNSSGTIVHLLNGTSLPASAVISTVSIGVLKKSMSSNATLQFEPPLSDAKRNVLHKMEMGAYTKSFVKFRSAVFTDKDPLLLVPTNCATVVNVQNLNKKRYFPGSNAVLITSLSKTSQQVSKMNDKQALASALRAISAVAGRKVDSSEVTAFVRGRFVEDELFRGSFSNRLVGFSTKDLSEMRRPNGRLFLAGEALASSKSGYATVKAAWYSGRDTAQLMVR